MIHKYYVVDPGYMNKPSFLSPFRGDRYHLQTYRGRRSSLRHRKELLNYIHFSLRNVIERYFGALKARFLVLKNMPKFKPIQQRLTVHTQLDLEASRTT